MTAERAPVPHVPAWEHRTYRLFLLEPAGLGPVGWVRVDPKKHAGCVLAPFVEQGLGVEDIVLAGEWDDHKEAFAGERRFLHPPKGVPGGSMDNWVETLGRGGGEGWAFFGVFARTVSGDRRAWRLEPGVVGVNILAARPQLRTAAAKRFLAIGAARGESDNWRSAGLAMGRARAIGPAMETLAKGITGPSAQAVLGAAAELASNAAFYFPEWLADGTGDRTATVYPPLVSASWRALQGKL